MDRDYRDYRDSIEASKWAKADIFYDAIVEGKCSNAKKHTQAMIDIMSDYFTENQRKELRKMGFSVKEYI